MKSIIFWDMTPCSLLSYNQRFAGTYRLHLQSRRNNFSKNNFACHLLACCFLLKLFLPPWRWRRLCSSETSVATKQTTRRHISEDDTLHRVNMFIGSKGVSRPKRAIEITWSVQPWWRHEEMTWNLDLRTASRSKWYLVVRRLDTAWRMTGLAAVPHRSDAMRDGKSCKDAGC
jgi:hypothetical protein